MRQRLSIATVALLLAVGFIGCEDAGKKPVQARVRALTPAPSAPQQAPVELALLPVVNPPHRYYVRLLPPVPSGKDYLIQKVKEKFASGEQNFKAGHLEAARKDFDDAVDWMLESGYDPNGDPKLSELFHRVVDSVYAYELQAFRAGDGFSEAPAVPAPIDEVAEMTFPVDPSLKGRAEESAKNSSHDLPLTVNDEVLSFLNFFQTPRGRAIVETGLNRSGRYREMISRVLREEGVPQDLIYLAQAEKLRSHHHCTHAHRQGCRSLQYSSGPGGARSHRRSEAGQGHRPAIGGGNHRRGRRHAALPESILVAHGHARGSFLRIAPSAGYRCEILRRDRRHSAGQVGQLAAPPCGVRRNTHVHREEIPCDGGGHRRCQQPGTRGGAERGREVDYPRDAAAIGNEAPSGQLSRAERGDAGWHCRSFQRGDRRHPQVEPAEDQQGKPRHGPAHLHHRRRSGSYFGPVEIQVQKEITEIACERCTGFKPRLTYLF